MEYICYTPLLTFEEVDEYIMKLKSIARDTDKLISSIVIGTLTKDMRLTAFYCNESVIPHPFIQNFGII